MIPPNNSHNTSNFRCRTLAKRSKASFVRHVRASDAPDLAGANVQSTEWQTQRNDLEMGLSAGERLSELHTEHDGILIPEAWGQNVLEIRQMLAAYGGKWWCFLSGRYRRACNELAGLCTQSLPKTQEARLRNSRRGSCPILKRYRSSGNGCLAHVGKESLRIGLNFKKLSNIFQHCTNQ